MQEMLAGLPCRRFRSLAFRIVNVKWRREYNVVKVSSLPFSSQRPRKSPDK